jgi:hypothetical protein
MKIRLQGVALLALCALVLHRIYMLVHAVPMHQATPTELALGLVAALAGVWGAAFFLVGPALFRPYAWPPPDSD